MEKDNIVHMDLRAFGKTDKVQFIITAMTQIHHLLFNQYHWAYVRH